MEVDSPAVVDEGDTGVTTMDHPTRLSVRSLESLLLLD